MDIKGRYNCDPASKLKNEQQQGAGTADWTDQMGKSQYAWQLLGCDSTKHYNTTQPRTPPTIAEIMGIRKAQHTIKCRKPRKAIAATSRGSHCHLLVEDDGLTELKVIEGCAEQWALGAKLSVLEAASEGEKQCSGYRNGNSGS